MHLRFPTLSGRTAIVFAALLSAGIGLAATSLLTGLPLPTTGLDFHEPGTQPLTLLNPILESSTCANCHSGYDEAQEPYERWAASMMGQAGRDPIFYAALAIANQDSAEAGQLCLRCHAPAAFLEGRTVPGDGSGLDPTQGDLDGVSCNFCHRMVDPLNQPGSPPIDSAILAALTEPPVDSPHTGQFVVDPDDRRRGPFDLGPSFGYHAWEQSPFHLDSRLCGTCHDVSNPAFSRQLDGSYQLNPPNQPHPTQEKQDEFPVERTFSEWVQSDYAKRALDTGGRFGGDRALVSTCQDCHMPEITGTACIPVLGGEIRPDLPQHDFNGANSWVLSAVRNLYPDSETGLSASSVAASQLRNKQMLAAGTEMHLALDPAGLHVRVLNHAGHKFPTGYGEGRRAWIHVRFLDAGGQLVAERGAYDPSTAVLTVNDTKVYEVVHGLDPTMAAQTGLAQGASFHFVLNNTILKDNRIPPKGFTQAGFEAIQAEPVGASFSEAQYWDDTLFSVPAGAASAQVRLYHQTTSKEYIEFLRDENTTDTTGQIAYSQWVATGKSSPVELQQATITFATGGHFMPVPYGLSKRLSNGRYPQLSYTGGPNVGGGNFQLTIARGIANQTALALWSTSMASVPYAGSTLYVGSPSHRTAAITLDPYGAGSIPIALTPQMIGTVRNYQAVIRDPANTSGIGLTNALHVEFSP